MVTMPCDAATDDDAPPPMPLAGFGIAWGIFWIMSITVGVLDHLRQGNADVWKPVLWEATSFVVASAIVWTQWRRAAKGDHLLAQPWRWFARSLLWLPLAAPAFVALVYALRHGIYALLGQTYHHAAWPAVFGYEMLKFGVFYVMFTAIVFGIRSHVALSDTRLRLERERGLAREAQLLQLTQQIEPHFLFNALNTIASTIHSDPDLADTLLVRLAALLRAATDLGRRSETTLDEELRLLEGYAAIMRQRFADRVDLRFDVAAAPLTCRVPTLTLQPLLENAFRHGVERRDNTRAAPSVCRIVVRAARDGDRLRLEVEDDAGVLPAQPSFGVGLDNLRRRLHTRYGDRASLVLRAREAGGVLARIEMPCES
jgi:two-component system, LytTR family, sensor kinase